MNLLDRLFRSEPMEKIFSDTEYLQGLLDFEAALARAESKIGLFPEVAARAIAAKCRAELLDQEALQIAAARSGNLAIPVIQQLTALVAKDDREAANFVHWGATSQDAMDSTVVRQLQSAFRLTRLGLSSLTAKLGSLAAAHRTTPTAARTWMQHAVPTTFGLVVAGWLDALLRDSKRLSETRRRVIVLQFGGAAGTLAALGSRGAAVAAKLSEELNLPLPALPWHSHRDRMAETAVVFGLLMGTMAKIARDVSLLSQTEIAELSEPYVDGSGGSSSMPHKRNPVHSAVILAAAQRVPPLVSTMLSCMVQEQQRGLGGWQAEWEVLPEIVGLTAGALEHLNRLAAGLQVHTRRMRDNLESSNGLIYAEAVSAAWSEKIGKPAAHEFLRSASDQAVAEGRPLQEVLAASPQFSSEFSAADRDRLFRPLGDPGCAEEFIARVLSDAADPVHSES